MRDTTIIVIGTCSRWQRHGTRSTACTRSGTLRFFMTSTRWAIRARGYLFLHLWIPTNRTSIHPDSRRIIHRPGDDEPPHRRRKDWNYNQLGLRFVDSGARLSALSRRCSHSERGGERELCVADQAELQRPASGPRLRSSDRQLEVPGALAWRGLASA